MILLKSKELPWPTAVQHLSSSLLFLAKYQIFLGKANRASLSSIQSPYNACHKQWMTTQKTSFLLSARFSLLPAQCHIHLDRQTSHTPCGGSPSAFPRIGAGVAWQCAGGLEAFRRECARHLCGTLDIPWPEAHGLQSWANAHTGFVTKLTV